MDIGVVGHLRTPPARGVHEGLPQRSDDALCARGLPRVKLDVKVRTLRRPRQVSSAAPPDEEAVHGARGPADRCVDVRELGRGIGWTFELYHLVTGWCFLYS